MPAGHPKQKWGPGCLWFGNLGRRGLGEESPYPCLSRILLTSSGQSRVQREPWEMVGRASPYRTPTLMMGEGGGSWPFTFAPLLLLSTPTWLFLPSRAGAGEKPLLTLGKLLGHRTHLCKAGDERPSSQHPSSQHPSSQQEKPSAQQAQRLQCLSTARPTSRCSPTVGGRAERPPHTHTQENWGTPSCGIWDGWTGEAGWKEEGFQELKAALRRWWDAPSLSGRAEKERRG